MPKLEEQLKNMRVRGLDAQEHERVWRAILAKRSVRRPIVLLTALKPMTALLIALALLVGGSGVVAASDLAKPGDALFGLDRAVERVRLSIAGENRNEFARKIAQERLEELRELHDEDDDNEAASVTEIEADVFTNETVVKLEINDRKFGFVTQTKTRAELVVEIANRFDLVEADVEAKLVLETEDRASRADDKQFLNSEVRGEQAIALDDDERRDIEASLREAIQILQDNDSTSAELQAALAGILDSANIEGKIRFEESDGDRFELRFKDGSIEVKVKEDRSDSDDDEDEDNSTSTDDDEDDDNSSSSDDDEDEDEDKRGSKDDDDDLLRVRLSGSASISDGDDDSSGSDDEDEDDGVDSDEDEDDDNSGSGSDDGEEDEDD